MRSFRSLAGLCEVLGGTGVLAPNVSYVVLVLSYVPHVYTWSCALWGALCYYMRIKARVRAVRACTYHGKRVGNTRGCVQTRGVARGSDAQGGRLR